MIYNIYSASIQYQSARLSFLTYKQTLLHHAELETFLKLRLSDFIGEPAASKSNHICLISG